MSRIQGQLLAPSAVVRRAALFALGTRTRRFSQFSRSAAMTRRILQLPDRLGAEFELLAAKAQGSLHSYLREASRIVERRLTNKDWPHAESALRKCKNVRSWSEQGASYRRYLVKKSAFKAEKIGPFDLVVQLTVRDSNPDKKPRVVQSRAVLMSEIHRPYREIIERLQDLKGTVLGKAFQCEQVKKAAHRWPLVNRIKVSYELLGDRWLDLNPHAFFVSVEFGDREHIAGEELLLTFNSGLDPLEDSDGRQQVAGFKSADTLGDARCWGGSEW